MSVHLYTIKNVTAQLSWINCCNSLFILTHLFPSTNFHITMCPRFSCMCPSFAPHWVTYFNVPHFYIVNVPHFLVMYSTFIWYIRPTFASHLGTHFNVPHFCIANVPHLCNLLLCPTGAHILLSPLYIVNLTNFQTLCPTFAPHRGTF